MEQVADRGEAGQREGQRGQVCSPAAGRRQTGRSGGVRGPSLRQSGVGVWMCEPGSCLKCRVVPRSALSLLGRRGEGGGAGRLLLRDRDSAVLQASLMIDSCQEEGLGGRD